MKHVYLVIAQTHIEQEVLAVYHKYKDAISHRNTEQENYRASGTETEVRVEKWEVFS